MGQFCNCAFGQDGEWEDEQRERCPQGLFFLLYCGSISLSAGAVHCDSWGKLESSGGLPSKIILLVFAG